jgi:hypothetical protein
MGIFSSIINWLFLNKLKQNLKDNPDLFKEDPNQQNEVKTWKSEMDEIQARIDKFCMRHPKSAMCKDRSKGQPHFKWR